MLSRLMQLSTCFYITLHESVGAGLGNCFGIGEVRGADEECLAIVNLCRGILSQTLTSAEMQSCIGEFSTLKVVTSLGGRI